MSSSVTHKEILVIIIVMMTIITLAVSAPLSSTTITAQAQEKEKFLMSLKLVNSQPGSIFNNNGAVYDIPAIISDNLNKSSHATYTNKTIEYNLKDADAEISDSDLHLTIPITVIDSTSKPNIITSYKTTLRVTILSNLIKERNTLTNITTYSGDSDLSANYAKIADLDVKATIYPNATGIMELREK